MPEEPFDRKLLQSILGCGPPLDLSVFKESDPEFYEDQRRVQKIVEQREQETKKQT